MKTLTISGTFYILANAKVSQPDIDEFVDIVGNVVDESGTTDTRIQVSCHSSLVVYEQPAPDES